MAEPSRTPDELDRLARQSDPGLLGELVEFLRHNKKWWLLPILLVIGLFGLLMALASSGAAPFIYTLF
jgi:hypothetical protein